MTLLPIVERELRVASRRAGTYRMRVRVALVAVVVFGWMTLTGLQGVPSAVQGRYLFRTLFGFAFVCCLFIGARLTADSLSAEKREGTLGLLFLTDLKGYDVVLGKLAATSVNSVYALLAIVPVMALPVQMGGVTAAELGQSAVALLNTIFLSLAAGIFASTLSRNERKAMFATVTLVLSVAFGPLVLLALLEEATPGSVLTPAVVGLVSALSPIYSAEIVITASTPAATFLPGPGFWWSVLLVQVLSWGVLFLASRILPRIWQARDSNSKLARQRERIEQGAYGPAEERKRHRTRLLNINPFLWLASRERWKHSYVWLYVAAVSGVWLWSWFRHGDLMLDRKTLVPSVLLFHAFLKLWIISEACTRLAEERRIGALELLLSTPLSVREILRGQWLALQRQFALPLGVVLVAEFLLLRHQFTTPLVLMNLAILLADVLALGWVGMWLALTARSLNRAILGTVGRVLILPWGAFYATMLGLDVLGRWSGRGPFEPSDDFNMYCWFGLGLANNCLFGIWWARRHLLHDFRVAATERYRRQKSGWLGRPGQAKAVAPLPATLAAS